MARLCERHDAYRWICGGVEVSAHTLSDFRVARGRALDELLTQSVERLMAEGLVELTRVAQDGMRVRAQAGAANPVLHEVTRACLAWSLNVGLTEGQLVAAGVGVLD